MLSDSKAVMMQDAPGWLDGRRCSASDFLRKAGGCNFLVANPTNQLFTAFHRDVISYKPTACSNLICPFKREEQRQVCTFGRPIWSLNWQLGMIRDSDCHIHSLFWPTWSSWLWHDWWDDVIADQDKCSRSLGESLNQTIWTRTEQCEAISLFSSAFLHWVFSNGSGQEQTAISLFFLILHTPPDLIAAQSCKHEESRGRRSTKETTVIITWDWLWWRRLISEGLGRWHHKVWGRQKGWYVAVASQLCNCTCNTIRYNAI